MTDSVLLFTIHPSSGVPIYRQLIDQVHALTASGRLRPGDMLPSVRQMASELQINMMTVSKAWARLEADGLLERVRGTGMRIAMQEPARASVIERKDELRPLVDPMVTRALQLGLSDEQVLAVVRSVLKERRS